MAIHNPVTSCGVNSSGDSEAVLVIDGAAYVADVSLSGSLRTYILDPDNGPPADVAAERIESATGFRAFRVRPITVAADAVTAIFFGWSTTNEDLATISGRLATLATSFATPDGVAIPDVVALVPNHATAATQWEKQDWIVWDGVSRIKTIAVRSLSANYTSGVIVEVLE